MIYLDYNATAPLRKNVIKKIQNLKFEEFGNPSSVHKIGRNSKKIVEEVRRNILSTLKAKNYDLIFTSGATESNNLAIKGFIKKNNIKTIFSLQTEHASVIDVVKNLDIEKKFFNINSNGNVNLKEIEKLLSKQTSSFLVSIMFANNESGIIHPINEIAKIVRKYKGIIHCDGVQGLGKIEIDLDSLDVDLFSISSHKIGGPTGIGALLINTRNNISPEITGGGQEKNLRSGTENFLGIVGFGEVINEVKAQVADKEEELAVKNKELAAIIKETEKEEKVLLKKSEKAQEVIEERILKSYTRIRSKVVNGLAVVSVDRNACGGCFNQIPPQRQLDIQMHKKVIVCEHCGRVLVPQEATEA